MTVQELHYFASARGYQMAQDNVFGTYKGYPFHCARIGNNGCSVLLTVEGKVSKETLKLIRQDLKAVKSSVQSPRSGALQMVIPDNRAEGFDARFNASMDIMARGLREAHLLPPDCCPLCGMKGCDSLGLVKGGYVPLHRQCLEGQHQTVLTQTANNRASGSYVTGVIGAILGGAVGTLPSFLLQLGTTQYYHALLYALIPICAYYGYKLFRGKMNGAAFFCTVLSAVLNLFTLQYLQVYYQFSRLYGMLVSPSQMGRVYWNMLLAGDMTSNLVYSVIFLALGLWCSWRIIIRTNGRTVKTSLDVLSTLQPMDGAAVQAADRTGEET